MKRRVLFAAIVASSLAGGSVVAQSDIKPIVRMAELEIDPAQLDRYKAILCKEIEASVRLEPGVLMLNAVSVKASPAQIRILEVYADQAAYEAHLRSPHFLEYKTGSAGMVRSLKLIETAPIMLRGKTNPGDGR